MRRLSKTFIKMFLSYTIAALLPLICMGASQFFISRSMMRQNVHAWQNSLEHAAEMIDRAASDIQAFGEDMLLDKDVQSFINTAYISKKDVSSLYIWKDVFTRYGYANSNLQAVYLYSTANNWVIGNGCAVKLDSTMYNATLSFTGMDYDQWCEFAKNDSVSGFYLLPSGEFVYRMNMRTSNRHRSVLLICVDTSMMAEMLMPVLPNGSIAMITDSDHQLILSQGAVAFLDGVNIADWARQSSVPNGYASFGAETLRGWHVLSVLPENLLHDNVRQMNALLLRIALCTLIVNVFLCLLLSKNNAEPLKRIVSSISSQNPREYLDNPDDYILIEHTMALLLEKNTSYRQLSDVQQELISAELVRRLLLGDYQNLEQLISHACLSLDQHSFGVVAIHKGGQDFVSADLEHIRCALEPYASRALTFHDRSVVLFFLPKKITEEQWIRQNHLLCKRLNPTADAPAFRMCVSGLYTDSERIHVAYDETVAMAEIMQADADNAALEMYFSSIRTSLSENYYDYPIDVELQIIQALKVGNSAQVSELFKEVRLRNYGERKLSAFMTRQLLFEVRGTVIRSVQAYLADERIDGLLRKLYEENTIDGLFQCIEEIAEQIADILHDDMDHRDDHLEESIYTYLSANFTNANLSLEDLVEPLGLSARFLYEFIRERFNSSFAKLLEGLRITKACSLLRDGEATIKNVASQVGYNSDQTFRLAFKRVMNVTPSEYAVAHAQNRSV